MLPLRWPSAGASTNGIKLALHVMKALPAHRAEASEKRQTLQEKDHFRLWRRCTTPGVATAPYLPLPVQTATAEIKAIGLASTQISNLPALR
jgi:hypothetical protein